MSATVIVVGDDAPDVALSSESVTGDPTLTEVELLHRPLTDPHPWAGASGENVVLLRAGDLLLPGAGGSLLGALSDCEIVVGAHRVGGRGRWDIDVVPPALDSLADLGDIAVDAPIELSAIAAKRRLFPGLLAPAPAAPGGEVALLASLLGRGRCKSLRAVVAQVRIRPEHRGEPEALLDRLLGVLHGPLGDDETVASRVRRRALSIGYIGVTPSVGVRFRPDGWWAPSPQGPEPDQLLAVIRDVHWVAARLAEARHIAEVGFDGVVAEAPTDAVAQLPPDLNNLIVTNESLHRLVGELTATVHWLHEEVRVRDEAIAAHRAPGLTVDQTRGRELVRELWRRTRRHMRRLSRGGSPT